MRCRLRVTPINSTFELSRNARRKVGAAGPQSVRHLRTHAISWRVVPRRVRHERWTRLAACSRSALDALLVSSLERRIGLSTEGPQASMGRVRKRADAARAL